MLSGTEKKHHVSVPRGQILETDNSTDNRLYFHPRDGETAYTDVMFPSVRAGLHYRDG